jgi:hypothetical protein
MNEMGGSVVFLRGRNARRVLVGKPEESSQSEDKFCVINC